LLDEIKAVAGRREVVIGGDFNVTVSHWSGPERPTCKQDSAIQARLAEEFRAVQLLAGGEPGPAVVPDAPVDRGPDDSVPLRRPLRAEVVESRLQSCVVLAGEEWEPPERPQPRRGVLRVAVAIRSRGVRVADHAIRPMGLIGGVVKILLVYQTWDETPPVSILLGPRGLLRPAGTRARATRPTASRGTTTRGSFLDVPRSRLKWTLERRSGTTDDTTIRTQYMDAGRSWMTHRSDPDGYEELITPPNSVTTAATFCGRAGRLAAGGQCISIR